MPMFNFQKQFAADVESREKRQTIRAKRKNRPQVGQTAYLYTGARTKACRKLGEDEITDVIDVLICGNGMIFNPDANDEWIESSPKQLDFEAEADGFENWKAMRDWFANTHGLPFEGDLIKW